MTDKLHVGILCGGKSTEHEISLLSARSILTEIDKTKYKVTLIGIDQQGKWYLNENNTSIEIDSTSSKFLALFPGHDGQSLKVMDQASQEHAINKVDVIFPVLHGAFGEDGAIQGLLKLANIPYVGSGVLASAIGMDKDIMKRLLRDADIPTPNFLVFNRNDKSDINFDVVKEYLGLPVFVKPANTGSSVGVSKASNFQEFESAINEAFLYDNKVLVEECIVGREIECAVLGNNKPIASGVGEIISHHDFYSYEAKYLDPVGATLEVPARLSSELTAKIQQMALQVFKTLCCTGMARVDFFVRDNNQILVNEINTIPGFTPISMYPRLWKEAGVSYKELIDKLINLALEQHCESSAIHSQFTLPRNK